MVEKEKPMYYGYSFPIESFLETFFREPEEFGSWEEQYINTPPNKIRKTEDNPDVVSSIDFKCGSMVYVVWAEWTCGDSFGYSSGGGKEAFGVFNDHETAIELATWLENREDCCFILSSDRDSLTDEERAKSTFKTSDGQEFFIPFIEWVGYFESLDRMHVDLVYLEC